MEQHIGPYQIEREIGRGGMCVVYLARDTKLDRDVAIKCLPDDLADDADRLARFEREAKTLASLNHPNIASIYGLEEVDGKRYLILEYVAGETLIEFLNRNRNSWRKCITAAASIVDALAAAHAKGVIHRDIKPDNVMFTKDGVVKLLDFGIAQPVRTQEADDDDDTVRIDTQPGEIMGTPGYMSPEQVRGEPADPRSDIFAFGCLLHEMVTGRPTFARETVADSMAATLQEEPKAPTVCGALTPSDFDPILMHCLEKQPQDRFHSARDLAFSLRRILTASDQAMKIEPKQKNQRWLWIAGVAAVLVIAVVSVWLLRPDEPEITGIRSLAVLPFENISGNSEIEYLADELPASIIDTMSTISNLHVVPRSTAFRLSRNEEDNAVLGQQLNVDFILIGQIQSRNNELRVRAELIEVATDKQQWSKRYDQTLADTLAVEKEITQRITDALQIQLSGEERTRIEQRRPINAEAHAAYLEGRFWWNKRTKVGFEKAIEHFEHVIEIDPEYALAYVGSAEAYVLMGIYSHPPHEVMPLAERAISRAIELDATLPGAHTALGWIQGLYRWDWKASEESFLKALELDPNYATAHNFYGDLLTCIGRLDEAEEHKQTVVTLDPSSLVGRSDLALSASTRRDFDEAIKRIQAAIEMDPTFATAHTALGDIYIGMQRYEDAIEPFSKGYELSGSGSSLGKLGYAQGLAGRRTDALATLEIMTELARHEYVGKITFAKVHFGLGNRDLAFEYFDQAIDDRDNNLSFYKFAPSVDPLRSDPRFDAMLERLGFPADPPTPVVEPWTPHQSRVAIMPFEVVGANPEVEFLADEIPASVIDSLAILSSIHVVPRSTAFRHRGSKDEIDAVGRQLNADFVLTGSIQGRGEDLRIRAELIDVATNNQLWSDRYDQYLTDTLAVEEEITTLITQALQLQITGEEQTRLTKRRPVSAEAHAAYLEGRFWWHKRTADGFAKAIEQFEVAIELDSDYALAYLGLADTYNMMGVYTSDTREVIPKSIAAIDRVFQLNSNLAEAYASRGWLNMTWHMNWDAAERDYKECIKRNPDYAAVHHWYGWMLLAQGRLEQSLSEMEIARKLNPGSPVIYTDASTIKLLAGQFEQARTGLEETLNMTPNFPKALAVLSYLDSLEGRHNEAIARMQMMIEKGLIYAGVSSDLGLCLVKAGRIDEARQELDALLKRRENEYVPASELARLCEALGQTDQAIDWLETALEERVSGMFAVIAYGEWKDLRSNPRFRDLAKRIDLDPDWIPPGLRLDDSDQ